jgi:hypothetical protein
MDAALTSLSSALVYRAAYEQATGGGATEAQAEAMALDAMDDVVFRYSQPVNLASKSLREVSGNIVMKLFMMFQSDPRLKTAIMWDSMRALATGRGDKATHIRRIMAIELMAMLSHLVSNWYRDIFSDDDDEEIWTAGGFARAALLAPLSGFFLIGSAADVAFSKMLKERSFSSSENPLESAATKGMSAARNLSDTINTDDPDAMVKEWAAIADTVAFAGPVSAVPAVVMNMVQTMMGAVETDAEKTKADARVVARDAKEKKKKREAAMSADEKAAAKRKKDAEKKREAARNKVKADVIRAREE